MGTEVARHDSGFTLLEVTLVVVILGIFLGMAIPLIANTQTSSTNSAAKNDATIYARVIRECQAVGGALPASFTVAGPTVQTLTCGSNTTQLSITDNVTVTYSPNAPTFTIQVVSSKGATYSASNKASSS